MFELVSCNLLNNFWHNFIHTLPEFDLETVKIKLVRKGWTFCSFLLVSWSADVIHYGVALTCLETPRFFAGIFFGNEDLKRLFCFHVSQIMIWISQLFFTFLIKTNQFFVRLKELEISLNSFGWVWKKGHRMFDLRFSLFQFLISNCLTNTHCRTEIKITQTAAQWCLQIFCTQLQDAFRKNLWGNFFEKTLTVSRRQKRESFGPVYLCKHGKFSMLSHKPNGLYFQPFSLHLVVSGFLLVHG